MMFITTLSSLIVTLDLVRIHYQLHSILEKAI